jgi:hypothetical protein
MSAAGLASLTAFRSRPQQAIDPVGAQAIEDAKPGLTE